MKFIKTDSLAPKTNLEIILMIYQGPEKIYSLLRAQVIYHNHTRKV